MSAHSVRSKRSIALIAAVAACTMPTLDTPRPTIIPAGRIVGRVVHAEPNGGVEPVAGATVLVEGISRRVISASDGAFELKDLPPGKWRVRAFKSTDGAGEGLRLGEVELGEGESAQGHDLGEVAISPPGRWEGRFLLHGRPVVGGTIALSGVGRALSDATGAFVFDRVLAGDYEGAAMLPNGGGAVVLHNVQIPKGGVLKRVVNIGQEKPETSGRLRGLVLLRGRDRNEARVVLKSVGGEEFSVSTAGDGTFAASLPTAGAYQLEASAAGFQTAVLAEVIVAGESELGPILLEPLVAAGEPCVASSDCASSACQDAACVEPSCTDGMKNGAETGADCGGGCPACAAGVGCAASTDCASGVCSQSTCALPSCADGLKNGDETALDCGGTTCAPCPAGSDCNAPTDCASAICDWGSCQTPSCSDGMMNGTETGIDCGADACAACGAGQHCTQSSDCTSDLCAASTCQQQGFEPLVERDLQTLVASEPTSFLFDGVATVWAEGEGNPQLSTDSGVTWGDSRQLRPEQPLLVRVTTPAAFLATRVVIVHLGASTLPWTVTTRAPDQTPDGASFAPLNDLPVSTRVSSASQTLLQFTEETDITVSGDGDPRLSLDLGPWIKAGRVVPGQHVRLRASTPDTYDTTRDVQLLAGDAVITWSIKTTLAPPPPTLATFATTTDAERSRLTLSGAAMLRGFSGPTEAWVSGTCGIAEMSVNEGPWTVVATVSPLDIVTLRMTSADAFSTTCSAALTVGALRAVWVLGTRARDDDPSPFGFAPVTDATPETLYESGPVLINGFEGEISLTLEGAAGTAQVRVNNGEWEPATPGGTIHPIQPNQVLAVRLRSAPDEGGVRTAVVQAGKQKAPFTVTNRAPPFKPGAISFTFGSVTDAKPSAVITSPSVLLSGLTASTRFTASGPGTPQASVYGSALWSESWFVNPGEQLLVRGAASDAFSTTTTATVTLDTPEHAAGTFAITTRARDVVPSGLDFGSVADAPFGVYVDSQDAIVDDFDGVLPVSVSGDGSPSIRIGGGPWVSAGLIMPRQALRVRLGSADTYGASRSATVRVGDTASGVFTVSTSAPYVPPPPIAFPDVILAEPQTLIESSAVTPSQLWGTQVASATGPGTPMVSVEGGPFAAQAVWRPGQSVRVRLTTSARFDTTTKVSVSVGSTSGTFSVTTRSIQTTPSGLGFTPRSDLAPGAGVIQSNVASLSAFDVDLPVSISGDGSPAYRIDGGAWTTAPSQIHAGQTLQLRATAPAAANATTNVVVTVGTVSAGWSLATIKRDYKPDTFGFTPRSSLEQSTDYDSEEVAVTGFDDAVPVAITGNTPALLSINGGPFVASGTVSSGARLRLRGRTGAAFDTSYGFTVTVGETSLNWSLHTRVRDITPEGLTFADIANALPGVAVVSAPAVLSAFDGPLDATVTNGELRVSNGAWATSGRIMPGEKLELRTTSNTVRGGSTRATVNVGAASATFTVSTLPWDLTPDPFDFHDVAAVAPSRLVTSNTITITGLEAPALVSVAGDPTAQLSVDGAPFAASGTIYSGATLRLRVLGPASTADITRLTCTVGTVTADWIVSAHGYDPVPDPFSFADRIGIDATGRASNIDVRSETVIVKGFSGLLDAQAAPTSARFWISTDGGTTWVDTVQVSSGTPIQLRMLVDDVFAKESVALLELGPARVSWRVKTRDLGPQDSVTYNNTGFVAPVGTPSKIQLRPLPTLQPMNIESVSITPAGAGPVIRGAIPGDPTQPSGCCEFTFTPVVPETAHSLVITWSGGFTIRWNFVTAPGNASSPNGTCTPSPGGAHCTFAPNGAPQIAVVPPGARRLKIKAWGGGGGYAGGPGGFTMVDVDLTAAGIQAGAQLTVMTGAGGKLACGRSHPSVVQGLAPAATGNAFPGGGAGGATTGADSCFGGGGGYSAVLQGQTVLAVAGGGGGGAVTLAGSNTTTQRGGGGGGTQGLKGDVITSGFQLLGGGGGTERSGGGGGFSNNYGPGADGASFRGGNGGDAGSASPGGGGGGGWFGGGGGAASGYRGNAGGGGSGRVGTLPGVSGFALASRDPRRQYASGVTPERAAMAGSSLPLTCGDGIQNAGESGIDCGGPCPICSRSTATCAATADCLYGNYCDATTRTCQSYAGLDEDLAIASRTGSDTGHDGGDGRVELFFSSPTP